MRLFRFLTAVATTLVLSAGGASAALAPGDSGLFGHGLGALPTSAGQPEPKLKNVRLLAHIDPGGGFNADVVVRGGFAYLGSWGTPAPEELPPATFCPSRGVRVFDLQDPRRPAQVATFADAASEPDLAGTWTEKVIVRRVSTPSFHGTLAAVSIQNCMPDAFRGFGLWDVTDPRNPSRLALYETPNTGGSHEIWLQPRRGHAYVYTAIPFSELTTSPTFDPETFDATTPGEPDFRIIDVSDPTSPVQVGAWGAWAELGIKPTEGYGNDFPASFVHSVIGRGTRAYLSHWDLGTVILDVSDPSQPRHVSHTPFPTIGNRADEEGNAHSAWVRGDLLVQTDEDVNPEAGEDTEPGWGYARFYDISNPSRPRFLRNLQLPTTKQVPPPFPGIFSVHDPKIRGDLLYLSWYSEGVAVADISDLRRARIVAHFVPPPAPDPMHFFDVFALGVENAEFPFVWGVFVTRRFAVASDINSGLWIFRVRR